MGFPFASPIGRRTTACITTIILGLLFHSDLTAQQFIVGQPVGKNRDAALYEQFMQQLQLQKLAAENRIDFCLNDIDHACQLTDVQRRKLVVAGKGAVESYMTTETEQIKKSAQQVGFDFEPGSPPEKVNEEKEQANALPAQNVFAMNVVQGMNPEDNTVEQQKIWKLSIQKVLTEEQDRKLQSWVSQRQRRLEQAAVDGFVARVDRELLLSPEQREKLTAWIGETYATQLAKKSEDRQMGFVVMNIGQGEQSPAVNGIVAAILTESQRNVWATSFQTELDELNQVQGNVRGAVRAIRMLPAARIQVDDDN